MRRSLNADERAIWHQVTRTIRPIRPKPAVEIATPVVGKAVPSKKATSPAPPNFLLTTPKPLPAQKQPGQTLDGNWDKSLATGKVAPDRTIDLHGHTLASAHAVLDLALGDAIRQGARLILLITGKPAAHNPRMPPTGRGVIRASVLDWIEAGPHAGRIAAIRNAHPRHGGAGALYIIIRRNRLG